MLDKYLRPWEIIGRLDSYRELFKVIKVWHGASVKLASLFGELTFSLESFLEPPSLPLRNYIARQMGTMCLTMLMLYNRFEWMRIGGYGMGSKR